MLREKLVNFKKELTAYTSLAQLMIIKSVEGVKNRNKDLLAAVINEYEPKANKFELKIDELGTILIAQYQPKAKDLRTILMGLKIGNDLERISDHAVNIAESGLFLNDRKEIKPLIDIPRMGEISSGMLVDALKAFIEENVTLARAVCQRDDLVDGLKNQIVRELITFMSEKPEIIERAMALIRIAYNLERIADLTTNICEDVVFMAEGAVIKHHFAE